MSRAHDSQGRLISLWKIPNGIVAFAQAAVRKVFSIYPEKPWIPFEAIRKLDKLIEHTWNVLEIGSGMSTIWLAKRAGYVTSIEASDSWYEKLKEAIQAQGIDNVKLIFEWRGDKMSNFDCFADQSMDLLYIDGGPRDACLINGFEKVKLGGFIYMDNWDVDGYWTQARQWASANSNRFLLIQDFADYAPAHFGVTEGRLIKRIE